MTRVFFDAESGQLLLGAEAFEALLDWADGTDSGRARRKAWRALSDAGVLRDGTAHPRLQPVVEAISEPLCLLSFHRTAVDDGTGVRGAGWLAEESAVLAMDAPDELVEVVGLLPMSVPAALARVLAVGPRRVPAVPAVPVEEAVVEEFFSPEPQEASVAEHPLLRAVGGTEAVEDTNRWEVSTRWPDETGTVHTDTLRVIDSPHGFWTVQPGEAERTALQPASPTDVWRALLRRFPTGRAVGTSDGG